MEINAGSYYLRAMFAGPGEIDDRQPILDGFADAGLRRYAPGVQVDDLDDAARYVERRLADWQNDDRCSWAVAEPTTGRMLGEVGIMRLDRINHTGEIFCWTHPAARRRGVLRTVLPAVLRFGFAALECHHIGYRHAASNVASERLARSTGFTLDARLREAAWIDGQPEDLLIWSRLATDER